MRTNSLAFNKHGVWAIYKFEMARALRTIWQSVVTPVITTSLYFVVFGSAIGSRMNEVGGVSYGAYIVPGLMMLSLFTQSIFNASFGIHFPKFIGTIYELLSAPVSYIEIVLAYVGAAATKSTILGLIILGTASLFVPIKILHPFWMIAFLVLTAVTFSLFGFIIGIWAKNFEQLQFIPMSLRRRGLPLHGLAAHPSALRSADRIGRFADHRFESSRSCCQCARSACGNRGGGGDWRSEAAQRLPSALCSAG